MSDVFLSSQQQLTQALAQLNKTAASNPLLQQGAQVIVKHLGGNQLALSDPKLGKSLEVSKQSLQGKLVSGMQYKVAISTELATNILQFISDKPSSKTQDIGSLNSNLLPNILSLVSASKSQNTGDLAQILSARIKQISGNSVTLLLPALGKSLSVKISDPTLLSNLQAGQTVQVQLVQLGKSIQASIIQPQAKIPLKLSENVAPAKSQVSQLQAELLLQSHNKSAPVANIPAKHLISVLQNVALKANLAVINQLQKNTESNIGVYFSSNGRISLKTTTNEVVATLQLEKGQTAKLVQFIQSLAGQTDSKSNQREPGIPRNLANENVVNNKTDSKAEILGGSSQATRKLPPSGDTQQKQVILNKIVDILQASKPLAQSPSETISKIEQIVSAGTQQAVPASKQIVETLLSQIKQSIPQGVESDPKHIKQLFTSPPLALTTSTLTSPSQQQGLLAGLLTFLQVSLGARMGRDNSALQQRVAQIITQLTTNTQPPTGQATNRTIQDLSQLDQRGQLLREIGRLFANHQINKLGNAEQALQGQDSFYYVLPSVMGNSRKDVELLIRRTNEESLETKKNNSQTKVWNLTMKLSVGVLGEMLGKAKLNDWQLDLDIYTSTDELKIAVLNYLPLLTQRFVDLGIDVQKAQCQLGKIPKTLNNRPYHIFETQA